MYYLGADIGGSAVKLIAADDSANILAGRKYTADGSGEHLEAEVRAMLGEAGITAPPKYIFLTGAGNDIAEHRFGNIPRTYFEEFGCFARGAQKLSGISKAVVVSIGTGTAFVTADGDKLTHIGGSGVGGGTLAGLADLTINVTDSDTVNRLISEGDPAKVDLTMGDICKGILGGLAANVTAANFGSRHISHEPAHKVCHRNGSKGSRGETLCKARQQRMRSGNGGGALLRRAQAPFQRFTRQLYARSQR